MGAAASTVDARHVRIWQNLSSLESASARIQMLETLLVGQEYVATAKRLGIYSSLLSWIAAHRRGEFYPWPEVNIQPPPQIQRPVAAPTQHDMLKLKRVCRYIAGTIESYMVLCVDRESPVDRIVRMRA